MGKRKNNTGVKTGSKPAATGMILKYITKPAEVKAVQFNGSNGELIVKNFIPEKDGLTKLEYLPNKNSLLLVTLQRKDEVGPSQWIVQNPDGEFEIYDDELMKEVFYLADEKPLVPFLVIYDFERTFAKIGQAAVILAVDAKTAEKEFRETTGYKSKFDKVEVVAIPSIKENYYYYAIKKN